MRVKATVKTNTVTRALLQRQKQIAEAKTRELEKIGRQQVQVVQNRIANSKTDANGNAWRPWSIATLRQRRREGTASRGLLYRTGRLLRSIGFRITGTLTSQVLTIYSNVPYARYLQFGTNRMPARPFLGFRNQINRILTQLRNSVQ